MKFPGGLLIFFGISLSGFLASADILFLDLNDSPKEIEAAQRAAAKRGEKLIVLPTVTASQKADLQRARDEVRRTQQIQRQQCRGSRTRACEQAENAYISAVESVGQYQPQVNFDVLKKELESMSRNKVSLSSVIISGHDGNGSFVGSRGGLSDKEVKEAFEAASPLGNSVKSLMLWGCYTTNIGSLEYNWKKVLPGLSVIAGYDGSAPAGDKPASWNYLEDILIKEKALSQAADQRTIQQIFKSIRDINIVTSAICVNQDIYVTPRGVKSIKKEIEGCKTLQSGQLTDKIMCYEKAEPGCEDIPSNTQSGPLRALYNEVQATKHCHSLIPSHIRVPSGDATLRLMYDRQVRESFENRNQEGLKVLNGLLRDLSFPEKLQMKDLSKLSRKDFLAKIKDIEKEIDERSSAIKDDAGRIDDPKLLALSEALGPVKGLSQVSLNGAVCVPFEWIEPNARANDTCGWGATMVKAPELGLKNSFYNRYQREDESVEEKVVGPPLSQARKEAREIQKQIQEALAANRPMSEVDQQYEKLDKAQERVLGLLVRSNREIAEERLKAYNEKLNSNPAMSPIEKQVIQNQIQYWENRKKIKQEQGAGRSGAIDT